MTSTATRRIELVLHRPPLALYAGVRPTVIIDGRGQPVQWGRGTWQIPADEPVMLGVFLFNRVWKFGRADMTVPADEKGPLHYRAPALPFGSGRLTGSR